MAVGVLRQGVFTRIHSDGAVAINVLIGGSTYHVVAIKANGYLMVGNNSIDQGGSDAARGHRLAPGESMLLQNPGAVAAMLDGAQINVRAAEGSNPVSFSLMAIDNV